MGNDAESADEARSGRQKRLGEALRANLKRRKAQQRERADAPGDGARRGSENEARRSPADGSNPN